ncbi:hypothetical protein CFOL_v3_32535 [Cephalotus follicularis]|uniref:Uncharacterized protein n=1 Tax=Cephalotus follicularis TaxID=3775 RepID=A0A1Q3D9L0_CEPFO|nr:hypothetical protein CFOL_v3_32535 [Cephalotus follicularis]
MEDEKKKKRNKKKKNKQQAETTAHQNQLGNGQNGTFDIHSDNGTDCSILSEAEKQQLGNENELHNQKEAIVIFQETIKRLQSENDSHIQKEAALEETIKELRNGNLQKEVELEETINQLQSEKNLNLEKEAGLEMKILQLQSEKDSWLQKEDSLEEKIRWLLDEKAALGLQGASLKEKINYLERDKDFWILTESTNKETIASLNVDITRLQMQVVEFEESRNHLLQENQQLMSSISGLQIQLQNFETSNTSAHLSEELAKRTSENEELKSQIEAASTLVEKLLTENAELVEKVNELCVEVHRQSTKGGPSSVVVTDQRVGIVDPACTGPILESSDIIPVSGQNLESLEVVAVKDKLIGGENVDAKAADLSSADAVDSAEIVQIPLDDNEIQDVELQADESEENVAVLLTDAPLIGAPFRFMSFVASYVSGADLVNK